MAWYSAVMLFETHRYALLVVLALVMILAMIARMIYNLVWHPLAKFPGPILSRASNIPYCIHGLGGRRPYYMLSLHERYGPVVRFAPNELSFSSTESWKDIYGTGTAASPGLPKSAFYDHFVITVTSIVTEKNISKHREMRAQVGAAFSDRALKEQEPLIASVIDKFVDKVGTNQPFDLIKWFNLVTFEIMGELAFGVSFGGLDSGESSPWVANVQNSIEAGFVFDAYVRSFVITILLVMRHLFWFVKLVRGVMENKRYTSEYVEQRLKQGNDRKDFISAIMTEAKANQQEVSAEQLKAHAADVIFAGSETTATALAAITWYIRRDVEFYQALQKEIRSAFSDYSEINNASASKLRLLHAACWEALRIYPPVPFGPARVCKDGPVSIAGHIVPKGTIVSTESFAVGLLEEHFSEPWKFRPQRWLKENADSGDDLAASKPFMIGSRACAGRGLAWLEMRTILAKLIYRYDMELIENESSKDWQGDSRMYLVWKAPKLTVRFTPATF